jgi:hypothetical protein
MSIAKAFRIAAACAAICGVAAPAFALSVPGITASGNPNILFEDTTVRVKANRRTGGWDLIARDSGAFSLDMFGTPYTGKGKFELNASFDSSGALIPSSGTVEINGRVDGVGSQATSLLFSADLSAFGSTADLLGFNTSNIFCSSVLEIGDFECTSAESVYLSLNEAWAGFDGLKKFTSSGSSLTTLPIPATLPLLATGFVGVALRWARRRPKTASVA